MSKEKLFVKIEDYDSLKARIAGWGIGLAVVISFVGLSYVILPNMIAGTITLLMAFGYICLLAGLWLLMFKLTSKYIKQFIFSTKGKTQAEMGLA